MFIIFVGFVLNADSLLKNRFSLHLVCLKKIILA